jgi:hypothetical protein
MEYVIEVRCVGESDTGLIVKKGKLVTFPTEEAARAFGRSELEKSRYIASWQPITVEYAKASGHKI